MSPAGYWSRIVALLVDTVPMIALISLSGGLVALATGNPNRLEDIGQSIDHHSIQSCLIVIGTLSYFGFLHWWGGQTLGKMFARIRVVDAAGKTPRLLICLWRAFWQAAIQPACYVAGSLILMLPYINQSLYTFYPALWISALVVYLGWLAIIIDIASMLFNPSHRMLHDYLSGTFVVSMRTDDFVARQSQADPSNNMS